MASPTDTFQFWIRGVRFYIALGTIFVTLMTWWWASSSFMGSTLPPTRLEEAYAWFATGLIVLALGIGPVYAIFKHLPGKRIMQDARRLLGVSAAWFATLHATIVYLVLFKHVNPLELPKTYQQSFFIGAIALVILWAMAATSFDKAFDAMGVWWFRLHRLVYVAAIALLLHAFIIGVHATGALPLVLLGIVSLGLLSAHSYLYFGHRKSPSKWQILTVSLAFVALIAVFGFGIKEHVRSKTLTATETSSNG